MNSTLKMILAVVAGLIIGSIVNMSLITLGPNVIPPPEGVDPTNMDDLMEKIHLFQPKHFIFPFLGHAVGTLVGAFLAAKIARVNQIRLGLIVGAIFLLGGIIMVMSVPSPMWYNLLDLVGAYLPMGWLGAKLAGNNNAT